MGVEELFEIEVPDAEASEIRTVGQLVEYIAAKHRAAGRANVSNSIIFDQLRTLIPYHLGVTVEEVTLDAKFADLYD